MELISLHNHTVFCDGGEISPIKGGSVLCASEETMEKISRMAAET